MSPEERKEKLKREFQERRKKNKGKKIKSAAELNIHINSETLEYWKNYLR
jgi:hypothetical protein